MRLNRDSALTFSDIQSLTAPACKDFGVRRLDLFGSYANGAADANSDLDFLVEFDDPNMHAAKRFFGLLHFLEDTFQRPVDLLTPASLRNPFLREKIMAERKALYGE
ncbi:nucleotidyltransferase family protein [Candidatus Sumerlaeota bacterium]|nr:nucleotidyltransferase family protein [Candidatus Sumerlaeota bacterium]